MNREWLYSLVLGLLGIAGGSYLAHTALHVDPVSEKLVGIGVGVAVLGGLLINPTPGKPSPLLFAIKSIVVTVAPIVPWSKVAKDRRSTETRAVEPSPQDDERG